jgi:broad specificity phosphatase PhoE
MPELRRQRARLQHWLSDPDLAPVRDKDALNRLPALEGEQWREFWRQVAALLAKLAEKK